MKIGIFDSGLGGLVIAKSIFKKLPQYDYVYLGDTRNLPYGDKTSKQIYGYTEAAADFLFRQNCQLIIVACNTSSALALRKIQQNYLPKNYPNRRVLGVIVPTLEVVDQLYRHKTIGVIGTKATIGSHIYKKELKKIDPKAKIYELSTPRLTPLIERNSLQKAKKTLQLYMQTLQQKGIEVLVLGCTHYPILKHEVRRLAGREVGVMSQDEIIPNKLADYLKRHKESATKLSNKKSRQFFVTEVNKDFTAVAKRLFGKEIKLQRVSLLA